MAENTVKYDALGEKAQLFLTDLMAVSDSNGVLYANQLQDFANFFSTTSGVGFKGSISAGTYATKDAGWYIASNTGNYIMGATTIAVNVSNTFTIIIVPAVINDSSKVEVPISITIDATVIDGSNNAVSGNAVFDAIAAETASRNLAIAAKINTSTFAPTDNEKAPTQKSVSNYIDSKTQKSKYFDDTIVANSATTVSVLTDELYKSGTITNIKVQAATDGNLIFLILRKVSNNPIFEVIEEFTQAVTTGLNNISVSKFVNEDFYFGVKKDSTARFKVLSTGGDYPMRLYFTGTLPITSGVTWGDGGLRPLNIELTITKSYKSPQYITSDNLTSYPFNPSFISDSLISLNLTTSETLSAGIIKRIKLNVTSEGTAQFVLLRNLTGNKFKPIKFFECKVETGINEIFTNISIDEDFHFGLLSNSVQIKTAPGAGGEPLNLLYTSSPFTDATVWTESIGRGHNIEVEIETGEKEINNQRIDTGLSVCYCGDSITDFCDSVSSNGVQYIGYDKHIQRSIKFKEVNIYGFSGIKLAQASGFADARIAALPLADVYPIYLGTNDFALATQSTLGTKSDFFGSTGVNTFYGALRVLFNGIYAKNANAIIILITPNHRNYSGLNSWDSVNSNGNTLNDFANAFREIANYTGVLLVDLMKNCSINYATFSLTTYDNLHPNTKGYQEIANTFVNKTYDFFKNL